MDAVSIEMSELEAFREYMRRLYKSHRSSRDYKEYETFKKTEHRIEVSILPSNWIFPELGMYTAGKLSGIRILNEHRLAKSKKMTPNHDYLMYHFDQDDKLLYTVSVIFNSKKNEWEEVFITKVLYFDDKRFSYTIQTWRHQLNGHKPTLTLYDYSKKQLITCNRFFDNMEIEYYEEMPRVYVAEYYRNCGFTVDEYVLDDINKPSRKGTTYKRLVK